MKKKIIEFLSNAGGDYAFMAFGTHKQFKGDFSIAHVNNPHIVYTYGVSDEFSKAMIELKKEGVVDYVPCQPMTVLLDGAIPEMPMLKKPGHKYKTDHWVPILVKLIKKPA